MPTAATIAKKLRAAGVPVLEVTEGDYDLDGEIKITDRVSVQVGTLKPYLSVGCWSIDGESMSHYPERTLRTFDRLLDDINKARAE